MDTTKMHAHFSEERNRYVNNILNTTSNKKVVVAGPGTGKTYLFKRILKGKKKALTLTFINSLIEDLSLSQLIQIP